MENYGWDIPAARVKAWSQVSFSRSIGGFLWLRREMLVEWRQSCSWKPGTASVLSSLRSRAAFPRTTLRASYRPSSAEPFVRRAFRARLGWIYRSEERRVGKESR